MVVWYSIKCLGRGHPVSEAETTTAEDAEIEVQLIEESLNGRGSSRQSGNLGFGDDSAAEVGGHVRDHGR